MRGVVPNLLERSKGLIDLTFRNDPDITKYKILVHRILPQARLNPTEILTVNRGQLFRSATLRKKGLGLTMDNCRGLTRLTFDIKDFEDGGGGTARTVPIDEEMIFLRVQEFSKALGAFKPSGPILIIPNPSFYKTRNPVFQIGCVAPDTANLVVGSPIENPVGLAYHEQVHIVFPFYSQAISISNLSSKGVSDDHLFVSTGHLDPAMYVAEGTNFSLSRGAVSELIFAGGGGPVDFLVSLGVATSN